MAGDGSSSPFGFFIAPALREGFKICLLLTAFWIPDGKGLAKDLALSLGKAKALSKAVPIASETP
ncbi:MAG: RNase H domain-containing protein [Citrobacter braakii]